MNDVPSPQTITPAANSVTPFIQTQTQQPVQQNTAAQAISSFATQMRPRRRPAGIITREQFDNYVQNNYGVTDVHTGTQTEQETRITRHNVPPPTIPAWQRWDPGTASEDYTNIIDGIEEMIDVLVAIPNIRTIIFFQQAYEPNPSTGVGMPEPDTGVSFGGGELVVYRSAILSNNIAAGISTQGGTALRVQSRTANIRYNIIHEMGHGVAEAGSDGGPEMFRQYNAAVGWVNGTLFDVGQPAVRAAIAGNTAPPPQHTIAPSRWNDATVMEQPMSRYAVQGGPGEDFAETIAAYVTDPLTLRLRSPARYNFIDTHMPGWRTRMRGMAPGLLPSPLGDYPEPVPGGPAYA